VPRAVSEHLWKRSEPDSCIQAADAYSGIINGLNHGICDQQAWQIVGMVQDYPATGAGVICTTQMQLEEFTDMLLLYVPVKL